MLKKLIIGIIVVVALIGLAVWSPWYAWNINFYKIFGIENVDKLSSLKIKSLSGEVEIYVDNEFQGSVTDNEDFADIGSLNPGNHDIKLKKKSSGEYYVFERSILFESGVETVIAYDLGPNEKFSEGHIFYAKKNYANDGKPQLTIYTVPDMTKVFVDGIFIGETPLRGVDVDINSQHKIKLQKAGYDDLEFTILPESIDARKKLQGFDLMLEAKLFLQPIKIVTQ
jgi:hypothetical protein